MVTTIKTTHEEEYSPNRFWIGTLTNFNDKGERIDSFTYLFSKEQGEEFGRYIFFHTIVALMEYILYKDDGTQRAYMKEEKFDELYDRVPGIEGKFEDYLDWLIEIKEEKPE